MGMFDTVIATCPVCEEEVEFQSKAGDCLLRTYTENFVPVAIAEDLEFEEKECKNGHLISIKAPDLPGYTVMEVEVLGE